MGWKNKFAKQWIRFSFVTFQLLKLVQNIRNWSEGQWHFIATAILANKVSGDSRIHFPGSFTRTSFYNSKRRWCGKLEYGINLLPPPYRENMTPNSKQGKYHLRLLFSNRTITILWWVVLMSMRGLQWQMALLCHCIICLVLCWAAMLGSQRCLTCHWSYGSMTKTDVEKVPVLLTNQVWTLNASNYNVRNNNLN